MVVKYKNLDKYVKTLNSNELEELFNLISSLLITPTYSSNFCEEIKEIMGIVIAQSKISIENKLEYLKNYIPSMDDLGTCDTVALTLKLKENEFSKTYDFLMNYRYSNKEYELRFLIVTLLYYYLNDEYIDLVIEIIDSIHVDYYYTNMAIAWLISSMCFVNKEYTLKYLKNNNLDTFTYNKALQKIRESNKISKEEKEQLKLMKKK